jgi:hypothetical protein
VLLHSAAKRDSFHPQEKAGRHGRLILIRSKIPREKNPQKTEPNFLIFSPKVNSASGNFFCARIGEKKWQVLFGIRQDSASGWNTI